MKKSIYSDYEWLKSEFDEYRSATWNYRALENENYMLHEFLNFKDLNGEFAFFKGNAHPAPDEDNPFPPLIL